MKRMILSAIFIFGIAGLASAQSGTIKSSKSHTAKGHIIKGTGIKHSKTSIHKKTKKNTSSYSQTAPLDNRKIYKWSNGQSSTPTGKDASPINGGYVSLEKDTSAKARIKKH